MQITNEFAWCIEHVDSEVSAPRYYRGGDDDWSNDHLDAIRFSRKLDADRMLPYLKGQGHRVAEHGWASMRLDPLNRDP